MKERGILFTGEMVRGILAGTKIQTRRLVKPQPTTLAWIHGPNGREQADTGAWDWRCRNRLHKCLSTTWDVIHRELMAYSPYGQPRDRLWVRETWVAGPPANNSGAGIILPQPIPKAKPDGWKILYRESEADVFVPAIPWRPGIHMPRWASRLTLEITDVRVQRVQEISKADCIAEGMTGLEDVHAGWHQSYAQLWDSINGKGSWESNPFCWCITFKKL